MTAAPPFPQVDCAQSHAERCRGHHAIVLYGAGWPAFAAALVAMFRAGWSKQAGDTRYAALLGALREDRDFRAMWERHDIAHPLEITCGAIVSPNVGAFAYEVLNLPLPTSEQQTLVVQVPDSASAERLRTSGGLSPVSSPAMPK